MWPSFFHLSIQWVTYHISIENNIILRHEMKLRQTICNTNTSDLFSNAKDIDSLLLLHDSIS